MTLKRLELTGFKSFAKKTTLEFTNPITSIVGPNGSGKSNIVEAIRFALGEQSIKSLRGKSGSDLIFKGSRSLSKLNRASVSITFDNRDNIFSIKGASASGEKLTIDYDEITISREVYGDGSNKYLLNKTEVRLKDIMELISGVNIGSSGHHIISQGEADRVLNASLKDRREMVEDALGLKVYKYRLRDSERKLDKTSENLKEVNLVRREIAPHLKFLKRQVEKFEKADNMRKELEALYLEYFKREERYIKKEEEHLGGREKELEQHVGEINHTLEKTPLSEISPEKDERQNTLDNVEAKIREMRTVKDELSRKLGRMEGMIEMEENKANQNHEDRATVSVSVQKIESFIADLHKHIDEALSKDSLQDVASVLARVKTLVSEFLPKDGVKAASLNKDELTEMMQKKEEILAEIKHLGDEEKKQEEAASQLRQEIEKGKEEKNRLHYELMIKKREFISEQDLLNVKKEAFFKIKNDFEEERKEAEVLIGQSALSYQSFVIPEEDKDEPRSSQEERRKKVERLKIKLEDIGGDRGGEIMKEYEEVTERDNFLAREVDDLIKSIESLESVMEELREKIDSEFKNGIEKINKQFKEFFKLMFDGGNASLSVVAQQKRKRKQEEEDL